MMLRRSEPDCRRGKLLHNCERGGVFAAASGLLSGRHGFVYILVSEGIRNMQTEYCSCPGCSGNLVFRIREGRLFCDHCGQSYDVPEYDRSVRRAANPALENPDAPEDSYTECPSCGGEISPGVLGATETCPFCGNALILSGKIRRQAEPDFIIPFTSISRGYVYLHHSRV